MIQFIIILVPGHEVLGHVYWQDVGEQFLVVRLEVLHLLLLLCGLKFPEEVKSVS